MTVNELAAKADIEAIVLADGEREITGGYVGDLLSWVMGRATSGDAWITIMSNINIAAVAALTDAACILLAEGVTLDDNVRSVAQEKGINVLTSKKNAFELAALVAGCL